MLREGPLEVAGGDESYDEPTHVPLKGIPKYFKRCKVGMEPESPLRLGSSSRCLPAKSWKQHRKFW
jgi:hypothetical protein